MSGWDAYTAALIANANVAGAALIGKDDGAVWAQSGIELQGTEGAGLSARAKAPRNGQKVIVGGVKYMATNCTEDFLSGKSGQTGVVVASSSKALIICTGAEGMNPGDTMNAAMNMADDLKGKGF